MSRLSLALGGLVLAALPCTAALADTFTFDFSFTSANGISGSGVFTATSNGTDEYLIDDILSGTTNTGLGAAEMISTLLAPGSFPGTGIDSNDNLLFFSESTDTYSLDIGGMSYALNNGAEVNLFDVNGSEAIVLQQANGDQIEQAADITITQVTSPVPEPGTLALLGTGVLGLAGVVRRRLAV